MAPFYKCQFEGCSRVFKKRDRLANHIRVHTGERPFVCEIDGCNKSYTRAQHLSRHMEKSHQPKITSGIACPHCPMFLSTNQNLQKHIQREHPDDECVQKKYECPEPGCSEVFHKKKQLVSHRLTAHTDHMLTADKCYRCPHEGCGKEFKWQNVLKRHIKVHQGYKCEYEGCEECFHTWSSLRKHVAKGHTKVFSCEECGKAFSRKPNLTQHIKQKHGEGSTKVYTCPNEDCGRVYNYKSNLNLHIRECHEGEDIWKNRQRIQSRRVQSKQKKKDKTFAAKLCGLDDSGVVLRKMKGRKSVPLEEKHEPSNMDKDIKSTNRQQQCATQQTTEDSSKETNMESTSLDAEVRLTDKDDPHFFQEPNLDDALSNALLAEIQKSSFCDEVLGIANQTEPETMHVDSDMTELTIVIKHQDRIEEAVVAVRRGIQDIIPHS